MQRLAISLNGSSEVKFKKKGAPRMNLFKRAFLTLKTLEFYVP